METLSKKEKFIKFVDAFLKQYKCEEPNDMDNFSKTFVVDINFLNILIHRVKTLSVEELMKSSKDYIHRMLNIQFFYYFAYTFVLEFIEQYLDEPADFEDKLVQNLFLKYLGEKIKDADKIFEKQWWESQERNAPDELKEYSEQIVSNYKGNNLQTRIKNDTQEGTTDFEYAYSNMTIHFNSSGTPDSVSVMVQEVQYTLSLTNMTLTKAGTSYKFDQEIEGLQPEASADENVYKTVAEDTLTVNPDNIILDLNTGVCIQFDKNDFVLSYTPNNDSDSAYLDYKNQTYSSGSDQPHKINNQYEQIGHKDYTIGPFTFTRGQKLFDIETRCLILQPGKWVVYNRQSYQLEDLTGTEGFQYDDQEKVFIVNGQQYSAVKILKQFNWPQPYQHLQLTFTPDCDFQKFAYISLCLMFQDEIQKQREGMSNLNE